MTIFAGAKAVIDLAMPAEVLSAPEKLEIEDADAFYRIARLIFFAGYLFGRNEATEWRTGDFEREILAADSDTLCV